MSLSTEELKVMAETPTQPSPISVVTPVDPILPQISLYSQNHTKIELPSKTVARQLITTMDLYMLSHSPFDTQSRVGTVDAPSTMFQYLSLVSASVLDWLPEERLKMKAVFQSISQKLENLKLRLFFPRTIWIIQTDGSDEGSAAYCRGSDIIVVPTNFIDKPKFALERLIIHELFHVLSRNNPNLRDKLYSNIGFTRCNTIMFPESLTAIKLTNPDCPFNYHYITFKTNHLYPDEPNSPPIQVVPIWYSNRKYSGGTFFRYGEYSFMQIEEDTKSGLWKAKGDANGKPVLFPFNTFDVEYRENIGYNTNYIVHPEEVLADNFACTVNSDQVESPDKIQQMLKALLEDSLQ